MVGDGANEQVIPGFVIGAAGTGIRDIEQDVRLGPRHRRSDAAARAFEDPANEIDIGGIDHAGEMRTAPRRRTFAGDRGMLHLRQGEGGEIGRDLVRLLQDLDEERKLGRRLDRRTRSTHLAPSATRPARLVTRPVGIVW